MRKTLRLAGQKILKPLLPAILVAALAMGVYGLVSADLLVVRRVNCKTQYGPCAGKEEERLASFLGKNLIFLSTGEVKASFKEDFEIKDVYAQKVFPDTLSVFLEKRKPFVVLQAGALKNGVFLIDGEGYVLEFVENSGLPRLSLDKTGGILVGERVGREEVVASQIVYLAHRLNLEEAEEALLADGQVSLKLAGARVIFPLDKNPRVLIGALQLILEQARIEGKLLKSIDLRYSNPVIVYQNGQNKSTSGN